MARHARVSSESPSIRESNNDCSKAVANRLVGVEFGERDRSIEQKASRTLSHDEEELYTLHTA